MTMSIRDDKCGTQTGRASVSCGTSVRANGRWFVHAQLYKNASGRRNRQRTLQTNICLATGIHRPVLPSVSSRSATASSFTRPHRRYYSLRCLTLKARQTGACRSLLRNCEPLSLLVCSFISRSEGCMPVHAYAHVLDHSAAGRSARPAGQAGMCVLRVRYMSARTC
jgi:hypothetical protein